MSDLLLRRIDPELKTRLQAIADARGRSLSDTAIMLIQRGLSLDTRNEKAWEFLRGHFPTRVDDPIPFGRPPGQRETPFDDSD